MILNHLILLAKLLPMYACSPFLTAISAIDQFPIVRNMGPTIEGASVDTFGNFYAINQTHFMNLSDPCDTPLLVRGNASFFSSSRITRTLGFLVGDAMVHTVWKGEVQLFPPEAKMLQPNDMAMSADESRLYFSGMNYGADTGDLWYYDILQKSLHN